MSKEDQQRRINDIKEMIALTKLEKMNILEEQVGRKSDFTILPSIEFF